MKYDMGQQQTQLCHTLLQYWNTPSQKDGCSPAQKLFGHPIQDTLPAHCHSLAPQWQNSVQEVEGHAAETLHQSKIF